MYLKFIGSCGFHTKDSISVPQLILVWASQWPVAPHYLLNQQWRRAADINKPLSHVVACAEHLICTHSWMLQTQAQMVQLQISIRSDQNSCANSGCYRVLLKVLLLALCSS